MQTELSAKIRKHLSRLPKSERKRVTPSLLEEAADGLDKLTDHYEEIVLPTLQHGERLEKWAREAKEHFLDLSYEDNPLSYVGEILDSCPLTEQFTEDFEKYRSPNERNINVQDGIFSKKKEES